MDPPPGLTVMEAATRPADAVLATLASSPSGLEPAEVQRRRALYGPNAIRTHHAQPFAILGRQLRNAVLILLAVTATVSFFLGQRTDTAVIGLILVASVGLGFFNEYRAERATEALHSQVTHRTSVRRAGQTLQIDVTDLVPGDIVRLVLGEIVPADLRLLETVGLQCDESVLTGESLPVDKGTDPVAAGAALGDLDSCALMGTVVHSGSATGVVVATGARAEFGRIAIGLGERQPETEFQIGLRHFSVLLLGVAAVLTSLIFVANLLLQRPLIESLLFSLAIAVGITPQLLPAVVSTSLATGTRQLAKRKVLVKRLVCIEDLGDMDILVTDKTGTLTEGRISFTGALPASPETSDDGLLTLGLLATETDYRDAKNSPAGQNPLDAALWGSPGASGFDPGRFERVDLIGFDHQRRRTTVLVREDGGPARLVTKGAPEDILALCGPTPPAVQALLDEQFDAGSRVVAVATRPVPGLDRLTPADERNLTLAGFLVFLDR
ncbi:MAG: cation-translocating P-type ATPase, partial [Blastococcus sp.]